MESSTNTNHGNTYLDALDESQE
jgi:hypothetical protein